METKSHVLTFSNIKSPFLLFCTWWCATVFAYDYSAHDVQHY